jgi:beta-mannanase
VTFDAGTLLALVVAGVTAIAWLVRLEGRVNGKATSEQVGAVAAQIAAVAGIVSALQAKEAAHDNTRDEVIRLQEQIKHLTNLIERLLPASRRKVAE